MFVLHTLGANAREHLVVQAVLHALHRLTKHIAAAATLVADNLSSFNTDQRRDVPHLAQPAWRLRQ